MFSLGKCDFLTSMWVKRNMMKSVRPKLLVVKRVRHLTSTSNSDRRRVVVTGLGLVTPLGIGVKNVWPKILDGHCGVVYNERPGFENIPCKIAAFVPRGDGPGKLNLDKKFSKSELRSMSLPTSYAVIAADEALSDANWTPVDKKDRERTGVAVGMVLPPLDDTVDAGITMRNEGFHKISPFFIPNVMPNLVAGHISLRYGFQGPNHSVVTACTAGLHSIGDASRFIKYGDADVMVAGSTEATITPLAVAGFTRLRALCTTFNDNPKSASRPFDRDREGFVMGEGAGVVVLEELSHAEKRGAKMYGEILGYGLSGDAFHITAPSSVGDGAFRCMAACLNDANVSKSDIGYINAHATSTPLGDRVESMAIRKLFENHADKLLVSSVKGAVGHLLGASGSVEAICTVLSCFDGQIPYNLNLNKTDIQAKLNYVSEKSETWPDSGHRRIALTNSFGFGGTNGSLCIGNMKE